MTESENKKKEYILDIISTSIISNLILYFLGITGLSNFIILIPFIVLFMKYSYKEYFISIVLTIIPMFFIFDIYTILINFSNIIILSMLISIMLKKKVQLNKIIIINSILYLILIVLVIFIIYYVTKINPVDYLKSYINTLINELQNMLKNDINFNSKQVTEYILKIRETLNYTVSILPAIFVLYSILIVGINTILSLKFLEKIDVNTDYQFKLNEIELGKKIRPLLLTVLLTIALIYIINLNNSTVILNNLVAFISFIVFINGVLLLDYLMSERFKPILRTLFLLILILMLQGYIYIVAFGLIDCIVDIRNKVERRVNDEK